MARKAMYLKCAKCGVVDSSTTKHQRIHGMPDHVGTDVRMRCRDCADSASGSQHATMCRNCCPTQHGTLWPDKFGG
jgi:hypothetical protein